MFIEEFSQYLKKNNIKKNFTEELFYWLRAKSLNKTKTKKQKILKNEFFLGLNKTNDFLIIGNSSIGRSTLYSLYFYAESLDNQEKARFIHSMNKNIK